MKTRVFSPPFTHTHTHTHTHNEQKYSSLLSSCNIIKKHLQTVSEWAFTALWYTGTWGGGPRGKWCVNVLLDVYGAYSTGFSILLCVWMGLSCWGRSIKLNHTFAKVSVKCGHYTCGSYAAAVLLCITSRHHWPDHFQWEVDDFHVLLFIYDEIWSCKCDALFDINLWRCFYPTLLFSSFKIKVLYNLCRNAFYLPAEFAMFL